MQKEWVGLGDQAHGPVVDGRIVAIIYAERSGPYQGRETWELWWIPVDDLNGRDVLFGVGEGAGQAWEDRWDRARAVTELEFFGYPSD